jgi:hypothetical protein
VENIYEKDTREQVALPVYEISWMIDNFSPEDLQAVIDSLKRWKPAHMTVWQEIMDILLLKDMPMEALDKTGDTNGLLYLSRIASELGQGIPYRFYLAISESNADGIKKVKVEGVAEVLIYPFGRENYDCEIATLEVRGAGENKEGFTGLGRQLLRYTIQKELETGVKNVKFRLSGIADTLLKNEGLDVSMIYGRKGLEELILKGGRKTLGLLKSSVSVNSSL